MENNKKTRSGPKIAAAVLLALLLILIFLSKTIYSHNLPIVTATLPFKGKLNKVEMTTGIVNYEASAELYSSVTGKIDSILIREGDEVKKGQLIFEMNFDGADTDILKQISSLEDEHKKKLDDLAFSRKKLMLDIEKINLNISNIRRKMDELAQEVYKSDDISDYDIQQCEKDIEKANEELKSLQLLYEVGAVSRGELQASERNLKSLMDKYENLKKIRTDNLAKNSENTSDKETNRQKQLRDYEFQLESYNQELTVKGLDLNSNSMQELAYIKDYENKLADYNEKYIEYTENAKIYAPEDSIVTSIYINRGQHVNANQQLASFGLTGGYVVECEVSLNNNFTLTGDTVKLSNSTHTAYGTVTKVVPTERAKTVTVSVNEEGISAGETFEILLEKKSDETYTLVPNGAINKDSDGYFLRQVIRRDGILGKEFYTDKLRILIGDSDSDNTAVIKGIGFYEPVSLISDKPFTDGETIKLKNESDFFAE